jgi:cyclase
MLKKRIIPCLDVKDGRTVKGTNFIDLKDAGDPVELAKKYVEQGADELVFLDITATIEGRKTFVRLVERVAEAINIPFTVGGGINSLKDAATVIRAGADKVSINSAAVKAPRLISDIAADFGQQCTVVAIDTKYVENVWKVFVNGGRTPTGLNTIDWALTAEQLGAGEILLTSMNNDGVRNGFAIDITGDVSAVLNIPVIASGGAGKADDFYEVFHLTKAGAALAAGIFHFGIMDIRDLKDFLYEKSIPVRKLIKT